MATSFVEFKLNFQNHLIKSDLPNYREAITSYRNSVPGAPLKIDFRQQRPGVFIIKCSEEDSKKLENKSLTFYYGKKQERQIKVKFDKLPKYQAFADPKWVTFDWIQESSLRFAGDKVFDDFLSNYGTIIEATKDDQNELGMTNGRKKARIDLDKGLSIDRINWIEADIKLEGVEKHVKGKVKIFYANQPVLCRDCDNKHPGKCAAKIKKEEILVTYEKKRQAKNKTFIVSDSTLRHINEKSLYSKTHIASGAKIGHIVNVLDQYETNDVENIIINAGLNNIQGGDDVNYDRWYEKQKPEFSRLQNSLLNLASAGKNVRVLDVPKVPAVIGDVKISKMRESINKSLQTIQLAIESKFPGKIKIINGVDDQQGLDFGDELHISKKQTEKLLQTVDSSLVGYDLIVKERPDFIPVTVDKIYSAVYSSYALGCNICTRIGHSETTCDQKEKTSTKRKPSGNEEKPNKKTNS